jgi:Fe-S-cluster containining protein
MTWTCREGCGECCGPVRIPVSIYDRFIHLAQKDPDIEIRSGGHVFAVCQDLLCVFLDRETKKCVIYPHRPPVCRQYGRIPALPCPYIMRNGEPRSPAHTTFMKKMIDAQVDAAIAMFAGGYR